MKTKFVYLLFIGLITLVHFSLYCVFRGGWGFPAAWLSARGGVGSASHWFLMFGNSILIGTVVSLACTIFVWYMKAHRYKFDVFISYRHDIGDDSGLGAACSLASKVETYLKVEQGLRVSLDSKTHLNDFQKNLPRRIKKSRSVLFLKTDHSLEPRWSDSGGAEQRDWVYEELCTALDNHIPLCVVWPNTSEEDKAYLPKELWYVPQDIPEGKRKLREYARKLKILKNYDVIEIAPGKQFSGMMEALFKSDNGIEDRPLPMETKQERYIRWGAFAASHLVALLAGLACVVLSVWGMEIIATQPNPDAGKSEAIMMGPQIKRVESKLDHLDLEGFPELKIKREEINGALSIGKRLLGEKDWSRAVPCLAGVTNGWAVLMKGLAQSEAEVAAEIGVKLESLSVEGSETFKEKSGQIVQHFTEGKEKLAVGEFEVAVDFFSLGRKKWSSLAKDMATEMEARADKANAGLASLEVESTQLKEQVVKCEEKLAVGRTAFGKEEFENAVRYFREVVSLAEVIQMEVAKEKATGLKKTALECRQIAQKVLKQCDGIAKLRELKEKTDDIKKTFESGVKEMEEEKFEDAITAYEEVRKMWADLEPTALREVERKISNALSYAKERGTLVANELAGEELKSDYKKLQGYINSSHVKKDENDYGEALNLLQRVEDLKPIFEKELEVLKRKMTEMEARRETEERARTAGEKAKLALAWMEAKNFSNQTKAIMDRVAAIKEDMRKGEIALKSQEWEQAVSFFEVVDQDWNWLKEHYQSETVKESVPPSDPVDPVASVPVTTPENMMINLPGGVVLEMVYCPPGTFQMGSPESEPYRLPNETAHQVTLTKGFWIGKYEVTQEQWKTVMGNTSNGLQDSQNGRYPVYQVSYQECLQFCSRIRQMAQTQGSTVRRGRFRLPTEAEWEYACRAGSTTAYPWGNDYNAQKLNCNSMGTNPPNSRLQPVGTYSANAWGLYDMLGNVLEWCSDYYEPFKSDPLVDPQGARFSQTRVLRGGSWADVIVSCRSASRIFYAPNKGMGNFGFRLCYSER